MPVSGFSSPNQVNWPIRSRVRSSMTLNAASGTPGYRLWSRVDATQPSWLVTVMARHA
jgi:hypothetical protein